MFLITNSVGASKSDPLVTIVSEASHALSPREKQLPREQLLSRATGVAAVERAPESSMP